MLFGMLIQRPSVCRLSTKKELGELLIKEFFMLVLRKWVALINCDDCPSKLLNPIITFIENVSTGLQHYLYCNCFYLNTLVCLLTTGPSYQTPE